MNRHFASTSNKIALLATGDEISNGDILNSNAQIIAQTLTKHGMRIGMHMTVVDNTPEIVQALTFLLQTHRAVIMTGGLGPTSDDLTRYALSEVVGQPLVFDEATWNAICDRFKLLGYAGEPPAGNHQQALFPKGATIITNPNGTAAGCAVQYREQFIFMLPGPPFECLPMVDNVVLPTLSQAGFQEIAFFASWLLFGVGESFIAEKLDALVKPYHCTTGYRLAYPYIEFKIFSNEEKEFQELVPLIEKLIQPYLLNDGKQTASARLQDTLKKLNFALTVQDDATGGLLESMLKTPETCAHIDFSVTAKPWIQVTGLREFWESVDASETLLEMRFANAKVIQKSVPLRGRSSRVKLYAVELICQEIQMALAGF